MGGSDPLGSMPVAVYVTSTDERARRGKSPVPQALLAQIVAYFHPLRIVLFGSAARGTAGPDSDLDLLVILDDDAPDNHLTLRAGWESRRGYNHPADIVPVRESVYRRRASVPGTLAYEAEIDGVLVYERP